MALTINTNVASLNAQQNLSASQSMLNTSLERLSSGLRINSAKDDAAGLAISQRMTAQINGLNQAAQNANNAISLAQTADGGLATATNLLQSIRQLAVESANGSNSASDRQSLQQQVSQLQQEMTRIANTTQFNGQNVLDGSLTSVQFQVGANANQTIAFGIASAKATDLGNYQVATSTAAGSSQVATAAAAAAAANGVAAQTVTVSGNGSSSAVTVAAGDSAYTIGSNVNAVTSKTGVSATAQTNATLSGLATAGTLTFNLYGSNATAIGISATVGNTSDLSSLAAAINTQSAATGITATATGGSVQLTSGDGHDIKIENFLNSAGTGGTVAFAGVTSSGTAVGAAATLGAATGTDSSTVGGVVSFNSNAGYTVTTNTIGTLFAAATNAGALSQVATIDISTVAGSNNALQVIDSALNSIDSSRAGLGALENRFSDTITNLQTTSQNLSSARSGIEDTDFAAETANLTKAQILQQAGTAMLAQANAAPQTILSLLK